MIGWQTTPASSPCTQLWVPIGLAGQSMSLVSVPEQATLSRRIGPLPCPKKARLLGMAPRERTNRIHLGLSRKKKKTAITFE